MSERRHGRDRVLAAIRRVRRRWRLRALIRGLAVVAGGALAAILATGLGLDFFRFSPGAVLGFRVAAYAAVALLALRWLLPPAFRDAPDERVALYLEEHEPSLDGTVVTAVDAAIRPGSDALARRLARDAADRLRRVEDGDRIDRRGLYRYSGALLVVGLTALVLSLAGDGPLRTGAAALFNPASDAAELSPYAVEVVPGDTTLARGADLLITARLVGFEAGEVELLTATGDGVDFEPAAMIAAGPGTFELLLPEVDEALRYFVRSAGVRSTTHRIEVADVPYVRDLKLTYHFPDYTGLEPRTVEDGGNVAVLPGTRVELRVAPTVATSAGRLVLDDSSTVALEPGGNGRLAASLTVREEGGYRIELQRPDGGMGAASPHYRIDLLRDQPPTVSFEKPGGDREVSPIEEVFVEARAEDDFGVGRLSLVYSVNGEAADTLALYEEAGRPLREVSAGHTFFLEEWELVPGDVVSYYAVARDNDRVGGAREVVSDIYFLGVRPFRQNYSAADSRPPPGGAGAAGGRGSLVEIQRQIVTATFNLLRDRDGRYEQAWDADVVSVALSQKRLRDRVAELVAQIETRLSNAGDDAFRTVARELPLAVEAMDTAAARLDARRVDEALSPEQRALLHLQRADEAYRDVQVSLQGGQPGGGGGPGPAAEDLADLFELEMDQLRDQYETVERGRRRQADQEVDEVLERLRELARRQQQEAERRRRAAEAQPGGGSGGGERQRSLADETEEAARRLERLARERSAPELAETARRLRDAAEAMRRSAGSGSARGTADARDAAERVEEARRLLDEARSRRFEDRVSEALERSRELQRRQREVLDELRSAGEEEVLDAEARRRLAERKGGMADELADLERQLDRAAARARSEGSEAARDLQEAAGGIRDARVEEKMRFSRGLVENGDVERALPFEEQVAGDLEALTRRLERAREAAAAGAEPDPLEEALDEARSLSRSMETAERRMGAGGPVLGEGEVRQLRREFRERAEEAEALGRRLEEAGRSADEVREIVEGLLALDDARVYDDPAEAARLQRAALEELQRLEFALRRELEARDGPPLRLPASGEVPDGFREMVEEYFRSLSEGEPGVRDPGE